MLGKSKTLNFHTLSNTFKHSQKYNCEKSPFQVIPLVLFIWRTNQIAVIGGFLAAGLTFSLARSICPVGER